MRARPVLWRGAAIVAWLGALVLLAMAGSGTAEPYVLGGVPLTVATGALVNRYWAVCVPSIVEILALAVALITSGFSTGCADCSDGEGWGFLIIVGATIFTIPATAALFVGVAGRRLTGFFLDLPSGDEPAGKHT